jgi:hypothetical protein
MRSRTTDIAAGLASLAFAGMFQAQSGELEGVSLLFPRMLIIFLTLGGAYLVVKGILRGAAASKESEPVKRQSVTITPQGPSSMCWASRCSGFTPASALFLFAMAMILGDTSTNTARLAMLSAMFTASSASPCGSASR